MSPARHASLLALWSGGRWRGVLVEGASGSGKSDLALRALDLGFRLISDDRTLVWSSDGAAYGRAPESLAGLLEVRGVGVLRIPALAFCRIDLVVMSGTPERLPDPEFAVLAGAPIRRLSLRLTDASAPHRLKEALCRLGAEPEESYQVPLPAPVAPVTGESAP
ncbi:MAG: HPr kinase/phosphorylase [Phenylobacterium sp.]